MISEPIPPAVTARGRPGTPFSVLLLVVLLSGLAYHAVLLFSSLLSPDLFPIPYAVPIFDTPFTLAGLAVGYLCLERHRLRHDFRSASLGVSLCLAALLALAHILAQPDYPGMPGVDPGVAPYLFFLSYLAGFAGISLAAHGNRRLAPLSDLTRFGIGLAVAGLSVLMVVAIVQFRSALPPLVMTPGRLTPFAIWVAGLSCGLLGLWALWGSARKFLGRERDWFAGFLLLAALVWLFGLIGFFIFPFRYGVSWYVAGLARPLGVGAILVGLLREQVWLYREASARLRDLESLHVAGQAVVTTLDPRRILDTITAKALELARAAGAVLLQFDARTQGLRVVSHAGRIAPEVASAFEAPPGEGLAGLAVARKRPVWSSNLESDDGTRARRESRERLGRGGLKAALAVPLITSAEAFGALVVSFSEEREFSETDIELLSAFGTQVATATENARAFEELALNARNDAALRVFSHRLLEASAEDTLREEAVRVTQELLHAEYAALFLFDPQTGVLRLEAGRGWDPGTVGGVTESPSDKSLAAQTFAEKKIGEVEDLVAEMRFSTPAYLQAHGVRAGIVVPLAVRDQPVGALGAYHRTPRRFSETERRVLLSLASQCSLALEKIRLYAELQADLRRLQETQAQLMQADKLKALGTLLSGMAHELNGPLSSILLSAQLAKQQQTLEPSLLKRLDLIEQECDRAARTISNLLIFARRRPSERRPVDLNRTINAALALQAPQFALHNIRVVADLQPALPDIMGDPHQLQQVFLNLLTNATHAMKAAHGRGTLTVRTLRHGPRARATVEDDGPGIPQEHLSRIFDPFFTTKGPGEGTGLGLSLSLGLVDAHGGRMTAENLPGAGARFIVDLPIGEGARPAETPSARPVTAARKAKILVVDDQASVRDLLTDVLSSAGHQVETADTGQGAIAKLEQQAYDLVTLDIRLPDISGGEVWKWIVARDPALGSRVVFMTGDTMSPETDKFLKQARCPILSKPATLRRIHEVVNQVLAAAPEPASCST